MERKLGFWLMHIYIITSFTNFFLSLTDSLIVLFFEFARFHGVLTLHVLLTHRLCAVIPLLIINSFGGLIGDIILFLAANLSAFLFFCILLMLLLFEFMHLLSEFGRSNFCDAFITITAIVWHLPHGYLAHGSAHLMGNLIQLAAFDNFGRGCLVLWTLIIGRALVTLVTLKHDALGLLRPHYWLIKL